MATARNFRISRVPSASRDAASLDSFAKFVFEPALESDELWDALREAFPTIKTHTERKKQAVLNFLMSERQAIEQEITAFVHGTTAATPADFSPVQDNASPQNDVSPAPSVLRKSSCSGDESLSSSTSSGAPSRAGSSPETLSLKQMTSVWMASGAAPPKIHQRRSMTTKEKEEYRRRRQMKACQDCRSRKRKCSHNMTAASSGVSSSKVKKRSQQQSPSQSQSHPHHTTPSESSFQLDCGSSSWGESSLMGSVIDSPLDWADFGPAAPSGAVEGFDDFLLLPDNDELAMAFSPDLLFSNSKWMTPMTTAAVLPNDAFSYAYADPSLPMQMYHHPLASSSSTSASAFSSPGRSLVNSNSITPAQMHQSPHNWDIDLAGVGVDIDFTGHEHLLHGPPPMPMIDGGDSLGTVDTAGVVHNTPPHRVNQPQASWNNARSASSSSTPTSATAAAPSPAPADWELIYSGAAQQPLVAAGQQSARTHTCEGVGTPVSGPVAASSSSSAVSNGNSTLKSVTTSYSALATGLLSYVPQSTRTSTSRPVASFFVPSDVQDSSASARAGEGEALSTNTRDAPSFTARVLDDHGQGHGHGTASRPFVSVDMESRMAPVVVSTPARASASTCASVADSSFVIEGTARSNNVAVLPRVNHADESQRRLGNKSNSNSRCSIPAPRITPSPTTTLLSVMTASQTKAKAPTALSPLLLAASSSHAAIVSILISDASSTALLSLVSTSTAAALMMANPLSLACHVNLLSSLVLVALVPYLYAHLSGARTHKQGLRHFAAAANREADADVDAGATTTTSFSTSSSRSGSRPGSGLVSALSPMPLARLRRAISGGGGVAAPLPFCGPRIKRALSCAVSLRGVVV